MSGFATTGALSDTVTGATAAGAGVTGAAGATGAEGVVGSGKAVLVAAGLGAAAGVEAVVVATGLGAETGAFVGAAITGRFASAQKKIPIVKNRQVVQRLIVQLRKGMIQAKL
ncbi:MAG: hypothetical protein B9S32_14100 [Verrucomicrobia bacterium Tous-C9LFEB]|nr:MAG: hypothetical protein B9S32_14100 [Verrucomicrobia bacterium Tous-C9LFEB]